MKNKLNFLLIPIFAGVLYASGFPMFKNYSFILGPFIAFFLLNRAIDQEKNLKKQLFIGWLFSLGFYQFGYYWIPETLKEFGGLFPPFNFLLGIFFSLILLPQVYIYVFFKTKFKNIIALSFIYTLLEFYIPQQFPSHLGHTFISLAPKFNLSLAPIFGDAIYTFIVCLISLSILNHIKNRKTPFAHYALALTLLIISFLPINKSNGKISQALNIRIIQPNIGNFMKLDSEKGGSNSLKSVFDNYYALSSKASKENIDLIVWPETAFPNLLFSDLLIGKENPQLPPLLKDVITNMSSELFIGGYDYNSQAKTNNGFETDFNTAFYFSKEGKLKDVYHKMKLIPFGEGLPFGPLNFYLSKYITNVSFFAKGTKATQFQLPNQTLFSSAICYEILFPNFIRDLLNDKVSNKNESAFIINLTNDSWYGDTFEPHQHLFLSKWRALEFNIPIIRSTNTGITTIIYPNGSESNRLGVGMKDILDVKFTYNERTKTVFQVLGIYLFIVFGLILIFLEKTLLLKGHEGE